MKKTPYIFTYKYCVTLLALLSCLFSYRASAQYCSTTPMDCSDDDRVVALSFAGIVHAPSCNFSTGYNNYTTSVAPATALKGNSYTISVEIGWEDDEAGIWIDYNHNNIFEASEYTSIGYAIVDNEVLTTSVTIPSTALTGLTRMRIGVYYYLGMSASDPCFSLASFGDYGEVDDYMINITTPAAPSCLAAPITPADNSTGICSGSTLLQWNKAAGAAGYDVYLNTGTGSASTIVSANQTDTFYTASTTAGSYVWKVVPKNSVGAATGCNTFKFTTIPGITPQVSITVSQNDTLCPGVPAVFTATPVNGGSTPVYKWQKNSVTVGSNTSTYTDYSIADGDTISVSMTSNSTGCLSTATVSGNKIIMTILYAPPIHLTADGPLAFCNGGSVTLRAPAGGNAYDWKYNGTTLSGANNASYTASYSGYYRVNVTTSAGCPAMSDSLLVTVYPTPSPLISKTGNVLSATPGFSAYQWYKNSQIISGATADHYTVLRDGLYSVSVQDITNCSGTSAFMPVNSLDVTQVQPSDISIYPNPAIDKIYVSGRSKVSITIRGIDGRLLMTKNNTNEADIKALSSGIYLVYISDSNGNFIKTEKITKNTE